LFGELEHLKINKRFIDEMFAHLAEHRGEKTREGDKSGRGRLERMKDSDGIKA
jgi:hypothetical protein